MPHTNNESYCPALTYAGDIRGKSPKANHVRGKRCGNPIDGGGLCWTHRKVVEIRGVSVEKVMRGER